MKKFISNIRKKQNNFFNKKKINKVKFNFDIKKTIIFLFLIFIIFNVIIINNFTILDLYPNDTVETLFKNNKDYNFQSLNLGIHRILFLITNEDIKINPNSEIIGFYYLFLDTKYNRMVGISLNVFYEIISSNKGRYTINDYFVFDHSFIKKEDFEIFLLNIEDILSLNIDYYFLVDLNTLYKLFSLSSSASNLKDLDSLSDEFFRGLFVYINSYLSSFKNIFFIYSQFINWYKVSNSIYTNISKKDLATLIFGIYESISNFTNKYFGLNYRLFSLKEDRFSLNLDYFYSDVKKYFYDFNVIKEKARVEIYNASNKKGVASKMYKKLSNMSIKVITYNNFYEELDKSKIILVNKNLDNFSYTLRIILSLFRNKVEIVNNENFEFNNFAGDLVIIIGNDFI